MCDALFSFCKPAGRPNTQHMIYGTGVHRNRDFMASHVHTLIIVHRRCPFFSWNDKAHVRVHWHVRACFASTHQVDVDRSQAG